MRVVTSWCHSFGFRFYFQVSSLEKNKRYLLDMIQASASGCLPPKLIQLTRRKRIIIELIKVFETEYILLLFSSLTNDKIAKSVLYIISCYNNTHNVKLFVYRSVRAEGCSACSLRVNIGLMLESNII